MFEFIKVKSHKRNGLNIKEPDLQLLNGFFRPSETPVLCRVGSLTYVDKEKEMRLSKMHSITFPPELAVFCGLFLQILTAEHTQL